MSDRDKKTPRPDSRLPRPLSDAQPLPASVEHYFLEVARGLRGGSEATLKLHALYLELKPLIEASLATGEETQRRIGELQIEETLLELAPLLKASLSASAETHRRIDELNVEQTLLTEVAQSQVDAVKELIAVAVDSRQSIDKSNTEIQKTNRDITDMRVKLMSRVDDDEHAPNRMHAALDFVWPRAVRASRRAAIWYGAKVVAGGGVFAAIAKIWMLLANMK